MAVLVAVGLLGYLTYAAFAYDTCLRAPKRFPVPSGFESWKTELPDYEPTLWEVKCPDNVCDPLLSGTATSSIADGIKYRERLIPICKAAQRPTYEIRDGLPLNPAGRTGLRGRGGFKHYGPNYMVNLMVVRGNVLSPEVMLWKIGNDTEVPFFTHLTDDSDEILPQEIEERIRTALTKHNSGIVEKTLNEVKKNGMDVISSYTVLQGSEKLNSKLGAIASVVQMAAGSIPMDVNTDNAWAELRQVVVDCSKAVLFCKHGLKSLEENDEIRWVSYKEVKKVMKGKEKNQLDEKGEAPNPERYSITCPKKSQSLRLAARHVPLLAALYLIFLPITLPLTILFFPCLMGVFVYKFSKMVLDSD